MKALVVPASGPVLPHVLRGIADAGVVDVGVVVTGPDDGVRTEAGDGSRFGISVTYVPGHQGRAGTLDAVRSAREWLADDDFVLCAGDGFPDGGIGGQLEEFRVRRPAAQIVAARIAGPPPWEVYFFTSALHTAVEAVGPAAGNGPELSDALRWLYDRGLGVTACAGPVRECGEPGGHGSPRGAAEAGSVGG
ncbi:sugar phosphate nucleotidyltransferase [Actinacidiphila glaucinigra]|uniref:sugar phosphate nucleotidyltransferase n=1 Tax=Actinacidiphila glaucinigra TaxID=235986 RepID=UPI00366DBB99